MNDTNSLASCEIEVKIADEIKLGKRKKCKYKGWQLYEKEKETDLYRCG